MAPTMAYRGTSHHFTENKFTEFGGEDALQAMYIKALTSRRVHRENAEATESCDDGPEENSS